MTTLNRVVINWTGPGVVGAAVTVLHYSASDSAAPPVAAIRAAFAAHVDLFPQGLTLSFPTSGDKVNDVDGTLSGVWSAPAAADVVGNQAYGVAAGVGACISWYTGGIVPGKKGPRKLRGRTFIVPIHSRNYATDGTLESTSLAALDDLGAQLQAAGPLAVWHRPNSTLGLSGNSYGVLSHRVRDKVAFLSSRRD